MVTMLFMGLQNSFILELKFRTLGLLSSLPPHPASANHHFTLCYYGFDFLFLKLIPEEMESLDLNKLSTGCSRSHRP